ncbi:syntaxin-18-like [Lineus longissimus]|uniref:syntaxin-18-like n=1 Tax=Lineus longissimus TaxID=88925 RepID=UPI002B4D1D8E
MADITNWFKATVKTVKSRNKAQGISNDADKNSILNTHRPKNEFAKKARDVVGNITKLRDFLVEHRKDYINPSSHLNDMQHMTDAERDQIDLDAQEIMKMCSDTIKNLRLEVVNEKLVGEIKEHREAVFDIMQNYLKAICKIYSEQRAIRVKRVVDRKRISRLEPERPHKFSKRTSREQSPATPAGGTSTKPSLSKRSDEKQKLLTEAEPSTSDQALTRSAHRVPSFSPINFDEEEDDEMSPEEMQMLEMENKHLFEEMNSMVDEVRQIEGKVVEISRLQEIFADKVLEQERDIDRIAETVVGSSENIKEGNEEIREAMKNNAGFRVWILFFLVVCSFSLLFLDWYNA